MRAAYCDAALVGTLLSFQLLSEVGNGALRSDYFRQFCYIVIPFLDGSCNPALLFKNHHASPLMHLHQMLTVLVLDVSLRSDAFLGITLFFCMGAVMAYRELISRSGSPTSFRLTTGHPLTLPITQEGDRRRRGHQPLRLKVDADKCVQHTAFLREQVWNEQLDASTDGRFPMPQDAGEGQSMSYFIRSGFQNIYGILPPRGAAPCVLSA